MSMSPMIALYLHDTRIAELERACAPHPEPSRRMRRSRAQLTALLLAMLRLI